MLRIDVPTTEMFNQERQEFYEIKGCTLQLEHSLVSISKWESKWNVSFLGTTDKTDEQLLDYIRCMTITQNVKEEVYEIISHNADILHTINEYIKAPMTATVIYSAEANKPQKKETITSELIYYWMIAANIPVEFQKWHLNRLLTLIKVCNAKNSPPEKRSKKEIAQEHAAINAARRKAMKAKKR